MRKATIFILALTMLLSCVCMPVLAADLTPPIPVDAPEADKRTQDTLVGALRFDGWSGKSMADEWGVGDTIKSVFTSDYSDRIPFFAQVAADKTVDLTRYKQAYMQTELTYAKLAGIDYFAYKYSASGTGLDIPLKYHLANTLRTDVKISVILEEGTFDLKYNIADLFDRLIKSDAYLRTLNDRAVIYVMYTNAEYVVDCINAVRKKATNKKTKLNTPFIIVLNAPSEADAIAVGADAVSWYNVEGTNGQPYAELAAAAEAKWEAAKANTKLSIVPLVTTGFDKRPIAANPISIKKEGKVVYENTATADQYAAKATPEEISAHLKKAIDFNAANVDKTVFNSVLMCAWNEFADGAYLCPTQDDKGEMVVDRLEAVRALLSKDTPFPTPITSPTPAPTPTPTLAIGGFNPLFFIPIGAVVVVVGLVIIIAAGNKKKKTQ